MLDLPHEPVVVHEYVIQAEVKASAYEGLEITDLSFYDALAYGFCSGSASSGPADQMECSVQSKKG